MRAHGLYDGPSVNQGARGKSFDESEPYGDTNKNSNRENSVAKIKVVVCLCKFYSLELEMMIS